MGTSSAARSAAPLSVSSLADRLRDGPLACLAALQTHAATLSHDSAGSDREQLERLAELVRLSQCALQRFQQFTRELHALVDELATRAAERH